MRPSLSGWVEGLNLHPALDGGEAASMRPSLSGWVEADTAGKSREVVDGLASMRPSLSGWVEVARAASSTALLSVLQ